MKRPIVFLIVLAILSGSFLAAQEKTANSEKLGKVHFPVSCTPAAQQQFDVAVSMLHSFWYPQDFKAFAEVANADPTCAMAYWGMAISRRTNPLVGAPDRVVLQEGLDAIAKGKAAAAKTQRERDYIAAIETYYTDWEKRDYRTRVLAYESAMEQMYRRYPEDSEAAIFYALALNEAVTVLPPDKDYTRQLKAAAILEKVLAQQPEHPGALHYLIHTYDFPPLAARGLDAANHYGGVAPSAPHALHMPSHTYSMLGMWQESITANQAALNVNKGYVHAMDFMMYAYLQGAQDGEAKRLLEQSAALQKTQSASAAAGATGAVLAGYTAFAAIPARYAIERGAWVEAAALEPHPTTPVADAITYFTRAMGSARRSELASARREIAQLRQIENALVESKQDYWAEQTEIQVSAASAWVAHAEGKKAEAVKLMRSAADREDASEKHVAMENRLWPMRELLGDLLLAMHESAPALKEYETSLQAARNRYRSFYGAAKAAQQLGDREKAKSYYQKLLTLCTHAETERPELAEAKKYLAQSLAAPTGPMLERVTHRGIKHCGWMRDYPK
jgi:tetratricopeptide (TPR) repeat protein